jgi:hypothetical protein
MEIDKIIAELDAEIQKLQQARAVIVDSGKPAGKTPARGRARASKGTAKKPARRKLSAEARKRIADAQRKRWAKVKRAKISAGKKAAKKSSRKAAKKTAARKAAPKKAAPKKAASPAKQESPSSAV